MQGLVHNFISSCTLWKWKCLHIFVYFLFSLFLLSFCVIFLNSLIYLTVLGLSLRIFSCSMHSFSCDMQDLVPWPGIKPGRDALEAQSSSHCSVQFSSVTRSCLTVCNPMNRSTPGLPVHHQLPEFTQTYVHWVSDATQPSHPLSSPSPPALSLSQHQGLLNESAVRIGWPNYWSFRLDTLPSNPQILVNVYQLIQ